METSPTQWLELLLRWFHVLAGIAWIGHAFFFHSIHHHMAEAMRKVADGGKEAEGSDMWMIHGGHFYYLRKTPDVPVKQIPHLLWFKWEAGLTWLSGFLLLIVVFYLGGGAWIVHPATGLPPWAGIAVGLGALALGWLIYDLLWASPLARHRALATTISVVLLVALTWGLSKLLTGRAAYLHVGAVLGTIMAANVWMRIIPGQRKMLATLERGDPLDREFAFRTADRSTHNGYMQFPVVFIMISNHYPTLYGHDLAWVLLLLVMVLGGAARQLLFDHGRSHPAVYGAAATSAAALVLFTFPLGALRAPPPPEVAAAHAGRAIEAASTGVVTGQVRFVGEPPAREALTMPGCPQSPAGPALDDRVLVADGLLQNAVVYLDDGIEAWAPPPAPDEAMQVDQLGCIFTPRVVGVRTGQPVTFTNSDPVFHNVRAVTDRNEAFNDVLPNQGQQTTRTFRQPELAVQVVCDPHPWMVGRIAVFDHPWFAVTGADGAFRLQGVPAGEYAVRAWHEVLGEREGRVTVVPGGEATVELSFEGTP